MDKYWLVYRIDSQAKALENTLWIKTYKRVKKIFKSIKRVFNLIKYQRILMDIFNINWEWTLMSLDTLIKE